jgi:hypothetical protein
MKREQVAVEEQLRNRTQQMESWEEEAWRRIDPVLNQALARLSSADRLAILLRYFDGMSLTECAQALGVSTDGARMRIGRAIGKMRKQLERAGVTVSAAALAAILTRHAEAAILPTTIAATPTATGITSAIHAQAAKGVLFRMNILIWKPIVVGVLGAATAVSVPVVAPRAAATMNRIAEHRPENSAAPYRPAQIDYLASNALFSDLVAFQPPPATQAGAIARGQDPVATPRLRSATPPASGSIRTGSPGAGPDAFAIRYVMPADQLPSEARSLLKQLAAQTADEDANPRTKQILASLRSLQKSYTTSGKLDEAVSVREGIIDFKQRMAGILPDPGSLTAYRGQVGRSLLFSVVGRAAGTQSDSVRYLNNSVELGERLDRGTDYLNLGLRVKDRAPEESLVDDATAADINQYRQRASEKASSAAATLLDTVLTRTSTTIWGTDIYTDDSSLSAVAVHAGLLAEGEKGVLKVTIFAGRDEYEGSTKNGITSSPYGSWEGSYVVEKGPAFERPAPAKLPAEAKTLIAELGPPAAADPGLFDTTLAGLRRLKTNAEHSDKLDEALLLRNAIASIMAGRVGAQPDPGTLTEWRGQNGRQMYFQVTGRMTGSIWGSDTYTDDSDIGTAAVHAGLMQPGQTGIVRVTLLPGMSAYPGTHRNGITTSQYGPWTGSYRIERVAVY